LTDDEMRAMADDLAALDRARENLAALLPYVHDHVADLEPEAALDLLDAVERAVTSLRG
jgi:hypothetical protein